MLNSTRFDLNWFEKISQDWSEGTLLDFKQQLYDLRSKSAKVNIFARHIIAFENITRRIGKHCWMFFGAWIQLVSATRG